MDRRWWIAGAAVVVVGGASVLLWQGLRDGRWPVGNATASARDGKDGKPAPPLEFAPREVVRPALRQMPERLEFSGPLVAPDTAVVRAKGAGTLLALQVAEGDRVAAGQALGRIDVADQASRVVERGAGVEVARTALAQAERTHASNERLAAQQFISATALDNSRAAVETARAQLAASQAALETTRLGLRDAALSAPLAGIVAKRHVLPGEKVALEQPVLTIVDLRTLELAGSVGTHQVSRLAPGMPVQVRVEGVEQPVAGQIARIAPAAEPGTRSIGVTIALPNPRRCAGASAAPAACSETFRAGQYAMAQVELADTAARLTVPTTAVGRTGGQDHVWVIDDGRLVRRAVTLGRRDEAQGRVEVLGGLSDDATVLALRFDNLREGAKALVVATRPAAVASAASAAAATTAPTTTVR